MYLFGMHLNIHYYIVSENLLLGPGECKTHCTCQKPCDNIHYHIEIEKPCDNGYYHMVFDMCKTGW